MSDITIYHNPSCSTSRKVLGMIRDAGHEPVVVEYLKTPLDRAAVKALVSATGQPVRALLRERGTPFAELGLDDATLTDEQLIDAMVAHPVLLNRPIVATSRGARLCRPAESVLELLPG